MKNTKHHRAYTISFDREDKNSPVVMIMQDGEATIYLTLKDAIGLAEELHRVLKAHNVAAKK